LTKTIFKTVLDLLKAKLQANKKTLVLAALAVVGWYHRRSALAKDQKKSLGRGRDAGAPRKEGAIDALFLERLTYVLKTGMPNLWCRETGFALLLATVLLLRSFMTLYINDVIGLFVHHLTSRDSKGCFNIIFRFLLVGVPLSGLNASLRYFTGSLSNFVREKLTLKVHELYMQNMNYYRANKIGNKLDATDQLIAEDIQKFSSTLCDVYSNMLKPVVDFVIFSIQLARWLKLRGPLSMYFWFSFASWVCSLVVPSFGRLAIQSQELEGDFRSLHSRLISNSEMIAFNGGEVPEKNLIEKSFAKISAQASSSRLQQLTYNVVSGYLNKYCASTVGMIIVVLPIFFNERSYRSYDAAHIAAFYVETTGIMQGQAEAVLRLFELQKTIGKLGGLTLRVWNLIRALKHPDALKLDVEPDNPPMFVPSEELAFKNVSIRAPTGELLMKALDLEVPAGTRIIISGENGLGKSSLFRVLRGLWPMSAGTIYSPPRDSLKSFYFLSQDNFVPIGSLREIIIYPLLKSDASDESLWEVLKWSNLADLVINDTKPTMETVLDWDIHLSPGQKQRMAFARLLFHRPRYAILDDCTNGVHPLVEIDLYNKCKELGITVLTISHKNELKKLHDFELNLQKDGEVPVWQLIKLEQS